MVASEGTIAQVTHCASLSLCLTSSGPCLQQQHYHPYFADKRWQPGEVRSGVAEPQRKLRQKLCASAPSAVPILVADLVAVTDVHLGLLISSESRDDNNPPTHACRMHAQA